MIEEHLSEGQGRGGEGCRRRPGRREAMGFILTDEIKTSLSCIGEQIAAVASCLK